MRRTLAEGFFAALTVFSTVVRAESAPDHDVLCTRVGPSLIETIPAPFDAWVTIICPEDGQQLVP